MQIDRKWLTDEQIEDAASNNDIPLMSSDDMEAVISFAREIERIIAQRAAEETRETCAQTAMLVAKNGIETSAAVRAIGITKEQA